MMFRHRYLGVLAGLLVWLLIGLHATGHLHLALIDRLDALIYDSSLRLTADGRRDERVVIVDIDERSLEEVGRWPWGRNKLAELVERIFADQHALLLAFDVLLTERESSAETKALDQLASSRLGQSLAFKSAFSELRSSLDGDARLARAIAKYPVVLAFHLTGVPGQSKGMLPPAVLVEDRSGSLEGVRSWPGYSASLQAFQQGAIGAGHINGVPDFDGVVRRVPLVVKAAGRYQEALSLAVARILAGGGRLEAESSESGESGEGGEVGLGAGGPVLEALRFASPAGPVRIPVDEQAQALVPYRGPSGAYTYVSAADVLAGRLPPGVLANRVVLLGTTAPGLVDLRVSPFEASHPGVEVHASLISGMLDGRVRGVPHYLAGAQLALICLVGLVMTFLARERSPRFVTLLAAGLAAGLAALYCYAWGDGLVFPIGAAISLLILLYAWNMGLGYFVEAYNRNAMARLFGQYVPPELVSEMSRDPDRYDMGGRSAELSILFADIRGFTALSEGMAAAELAAMMNAFFTAMAAIVREQRGTLDKYLGDAVMAFWGAPVSDARHATHSVMAALAMQQSVWELNRSFPTHGWPPLEIGIGVNSGLVTVGDMGSRDRRSYTVLGDAVNLAARLEKLTAYYGVGVLIGEATCAALVGVACREVDRVRVKGRSGAVTLYEPLGLEGDKRYASGAELTCWGEFLQLYRAREWDRAEPLLRQLIATAPEDGLYRRYLERVLDFRAEPPTPDWDGVWRFEREAG
jgi:adenylate cyclase